MIIILLLLIIIIIISIYKLLNPSRLRFEANLFIERSETLSRPGSISNKN